MTVLLICLSLENTKESLKTFSSKGNPIEMKSQEYWFSRKNHKEQGPFSTLM